jgi:hypothetical protein
MFKNNSVQMIAMLAIGVQPHGDSGADEEIEPPERSKLRGAPKVAGGRDPEALPPQLYAGHRHVALRLLPCSGPGLESVVAMN